MVSFTLYDSSNLLTSPPELPTNQVHYSIFRGQLCSAYLPLTKAVTELPEMHGYDRIEVRIMKYGNNTEDITILPSIPTAKPTTEPTIKTEESKTNKDKLPSWTSWTDDQIEVIDVFICAQSTG